jgi:alpha-N-arabinofuranosidase
MDQRDLRLVVSRDFSVAETDPRLFGSFLEHMGCTIYNGIFQPEHPEADAQGFRRDVLRVLGELGLSIIRYPGGNFVSNYEWEDGVGPRDSRPPRMEPAWKAIEPNSFGLDEYMSWLSLLDARPLYSVNLGTRGPKEARDLIEYCNVDSGTKFSDLRRSHGRIDPYRIKTWCLGNEMDGPWQIAAKTPEEYGRIAMETGKLMKLIDPGIELVASGSSLPRMSTYPEWDRIVLSHCYEVVDYISLHHYVDRATPWEEISAASFFNKTEKPVFLDTPAYLARPMAVERQIHDIISACDYVKAVKRSRKRIDLCFDEWNVLSTNKDRRENYREWSTASPIDYVSHTMEDALAFASTFLAILKRADRVRIACQSLLINTGGLVLSDRAGGVIRNAIFYPFMHISLYGRGIVLQDRLSSPVYQTEEFEDVPCVDSACVFDPEKRTLSVFAVNKTDAAYSLRTEAKDFGKPELIAHIVMRNDDLKAVNTFAAPDTLSPETNGATRISGMDIESTILPYSWNVIRLSFHGEGYGNQ